jgi:hypothetical protein
MLDLMARIAGLQLLSRWGARARAVFGGQHSSGLDLWTAQTEAAGENRESTPRKSPLSGGHDRPPLRRLAVGISLSNLGDGMVIVAIPRLTLQVGGSSNRGLAVGAPATASSAIGIQISPWGADRPPARGGRNFCAVSAS